MILLPWIKTLLMMTIQLYKLPPLSIVVVCVFPITNKFMRDNKNTMVMPDGTITLG
jgi:hypothetical protein